VRTMTAAEAEQVSGGVSRSGLMNAVGQAMRDQGGRLADAQDKKAEVAQGDGVLPWTPPNPTPCGENRICRFVL
jgi:hypothetical protein